MITLLWLGNYPYSNGNQIFNNKSMRRELVTRILQQMTNKNDVNWFNLEYTLDDNEFILINPLNENWLDMLAEFERI